jgi:hypothetical protein
MTPGLDRFLAPRESWLALTTRARCERLVGEQLRSRGFSVFVPEVFAWSWRGGVRRASMRPLFPGQLFLRHGSHRFGLPPWGTRGVLGVVPDREIEAVRRVLDAFLSPLPHPYVEDGRRVSIRRGPLRDVEGFLSETRAGRALLVLSVHLFRRSVAVEIDRALTASA